MGHWPLVNIVTGVSHPQGAIAHILTPCSAAPGSWSLSLVWALGVSWLLAAHCYMSVAHQARPLASQHSLHSRGQCVAITDVTPPLIGPASSTEAGAD